MLSVDRMVHNMRPRLQKGDICIFLSTISSKICFPFHPRHSLYSPPVFIRKTGSDGHVITFARCSAYGLFFLDHIVLEGNPKSGALIQELSFANFSV